MGSLTLEPDENRRALPEKLRREAIRRGSERLRDRIGALRGALPDGDQGPDRLEQSYPNDARWVRSQAGMGARVLGDLSPDHLNTLIRKGVWMSPRILRADDDPLSRSIRTAFPMRGLTMHIRHADGIREDRTDYSYDHPDSDCRLVVDVSGDPDRPFLRCAAMNLVEALPPPGPLGAHLPLPRADWRPTSVLLPPEPLPTGGPALRDDPRLARKVRLFAAGAAPERVPYAEVLGPLARVSGLTVLSDCYASTRLKSADGHALAEEMPLGDLLDRISAEFEYTWRLDGDYLLLRHARWFFEEQNDLPENIRARLDRTIARDHGLTLAELCRLARDLTTEQFRNLRAYYVDLSPIRFRHHGLRLFQSLSAQQRAAALAEGVTYVDLSPSQRKLFQEVTRSERPQHLAEPPANWNRWRLYLRPGDAVPGAGRLNIPPGSWDLTYQWGAGDLNNVLMPGFTRVDATREMQYVAPTRVDIPQLY